MRKILIMTFAAAIVLSGCSTYDPYTRERETSKATKGALGGALAGAIVGALTNTSSGKQAGKNALIGAGIGALAGGSVGYYMDRQEAKLRAQLDGTGVSVTRDGDNIILNMPSNITFGVDASNINGNFYDTLTSVALVLKEFDKTYVDVMGHTDSSGSEEYNLMLSERRSRSVAQYLTTQQIIPERLIVQGFGEMRPVADNASEAGRAANRRVEVQISPFTG